MVIIDSLNNYMFIKQDLPKDDFYEIYSGTTKIFQCKNHFNQALAKWCNTISTIKSS